MAWRIVRDVPQFRLRRGQEISYVSALRSIGRELKQPLYQFACPEDAGQHFSERSWPEVREIPVELGRPLDGAPADPAALAQVERQLETARQAQAAASEGLSGCRARLEEIERRTKIIGADHTEVSSWHTNIHHLAQWQAKLSQASGDVGRLTVELEALRDQQERAARHQTAQDGGTLRTAAQVVMESDAPNGEAVVDLEALRAELLRLALVVVQFEGLVDLVFISDDDKRTSLVAFVFPERAYFCWRELRAALLAWGTATGREGKTVREMRNEGDVAALFEHAHQLVEQAREQAVEQIDEPAGLVLA